MLVGGRHGRDTGPVVAGSQEIALSELISALSRALDIAEGEPPGHAGRSCLIGMRLAEALGTGTRATRLLAAGAFALWPTFTILAGSSSGGVLTLTENGTAILPSALARTSSSQRKFFLR